MTNPIEQEAAKLAADDNEDYERTALAWSIILGIDVLPWQVALCKTSTKLMRLASSPGSHDSLVGAVSNLIAYQKVVEK